MAKKNRKSLSLRFGDGAMPSKEDFRDLIDSLVNILEDGIERTRLDGLRLMQAKSTEENVNQLLSFYRVSNMQTALWSLGIDPVSGNLQFSGVQNALAALTLAKQAAAREDRCAGVAIGINQNQPACELDVNGIVAMRARIGLPGASPAYADGNWYTIKSNVVGCVALEVSAVIAEAASGQSIIMHAIATKAFDEKGNFDYYQADTGKLAGRIELRWIRSADPTPGQILIEYDLQIRAGFQEKLFSRFNDYFHVGQHRAPIDYTICSMWFDPEMQRCAEDPNALRPRKVNDSDDQQLVVAMADPDALPKKIRKNLIGLFEYGDQPSAADFSELTNSMFNVADDGLGRAPNAELQLRQLDNSNTLMSFYSPSNQQNAAWSLYVGNGNLHFCDGGSTNDQGLSLARLDRPDPQSAGDAANGIRLGIGIVQPRPRFALEVNGVISAAGRVGATVRVAADGDWHALWQGASTCVAFEVVAGVGKKNAGKYALLHAYALNAGSGPGRIAYHQAHYGSDCNCIELRWSTKAGQLTLQIRVACAYYDPSTAADGRSDDNRSDNAPLFIQCYLTSLWSALGNSASTADRSDIDPVRAKPDTAATSSACDTLSRKQLLELFKKGELPTERHFTNLINAMLNLMDDGLERTDENGLRLRQDQAEPDDDAGNPAQLANLLAIYPSGAGAHPAWSLQLDPESNDAGGNCLSFLGHGAATAIDTRSPCGQPLLSLGQAQPNAGSGPAACYRSGVQIGINNPQPMYELDVIGTVAAQGRSGSKGAESIPADGNWHAIRTNLAGCTAFEIMAGVGKRNAGQYAVMHALALNAYAAKSHISYHMSHYGKPCNRLELRWVCATALVAGEHYRPYELQLRVAAPYDDKVWVQYFITDLWFDCAMDGSLAPVQSGSGGARP